MPTRLNFRLNDDELAQVEQTFRKDKRPDVCRRATAIRLLHLSRKPTAVAVKFSVSEEAVYRWHRRYREVGLAALANPPKGRPRRKADDIYRQAMAEMAETLHSRWMTRTNGCTRSHQW